MTVLRMAAIVPKALNACALVILPTTSKSLCVRLTHKVLSAFRRTSSVRESLRQAVTSGPSSRTSFSFRLITTCSISTMPLPFVTGVFISYVLYVYRTLDGAHLYASVSGLSRGKFLWLSNPPTRLFNYRRQRCTQRFSRSACSTQTVTAKCCRECGTAIRCFDLFLGFDSKMAAEGTSIFAQAASTG